MVTRTRTRTTGRRWQREQRRCPDWCGGGHLCTAQHGYPGGEHRSQPLRWVTPYGVLVATRRRTLAGKQAIDITVLVELDQDELTAGHQAMAVAAETHQAVAAALARPARMEVA